jgi:hypothetical protein
MTKLIVIAIIAGALYCGWELFLYWDKISTEKEDQQKEAAAAVVNGDQLPGMPYQLQSSLDSAEHSGPQSLKNWLKTYDKVLEDPRKAWVQLDYVVAVSRENVVEAKRVFAEVKSRTPTNSPVWHRVSELEKTYD